MSKKEHMFIGKVHTLKCWKEYFQPMADGNKNFDVRLNDRDFRIEDAVLLREWDKESKIYTNRVIFAKITYILRDFTPIPKEYVVLGIKIIICADSRWIEQSYGEFFLGAEYLRLFRKELDEIWNQMMKQQK